VSPPENVPPPYRTAGPVARYFKARLQMLIGVVAVVMIAVWLVHEAMKGAQGSGVLVVARCCLNVWLARYRAADRCGGCGRVLADVPGGLLLVVTGWSVTGHAGRRQMRR
jgi:hypothetical protein